jgi:hypothetical protein
VNTTWNTIGIVEVEEKQKKREDAKDRTGIKAR